MFVPNLLNANYWQLGSWSLRKPTAMARVPPRQARWGWILAHLFCICIFLIQLFQLLPSYFAPTMTHTEAGVSGNSHSRPFLGIRASDSRSQSLGMSFSFPFPFPKGGNAIFHSRSCSQNSGMQFSIPVPVSGNGL